MARRSATFDEQCESFFRSASEQEIVRQIDRINLMLRMRPTLGTAAQVGAPKPRRGRPPGKAGKQDREPWLGEPSGSMGSAGGAA